jgi:hypothetical protein
MPLYDLMSCIGNERILYTYLVTPSHVTMSPDIKPWNPISQRPRVKTLLRVAYGPCTFAYRAQPVT